ncbi:NAD(P)H-dependent oxidoreductase [Anaerovorax odorimutans]|uniref:NAD(P)H-dependent oxidoreductase n=1 Tax=Anaerovorax odorimutans TaxID=109327 RepID=A0ABT1RN97_9FIRM|nr:NAD(P)H-dependent oxidoreductase [Anaerovorax odorimutans]MCQ4636654.1 NAD(P)H-dependent oxidoreductase [Anaerovorax odorimutans]
MKIGFINGSPKKEGSASGCLLAELKEILKQPVSEYCIRSRRDTLPDELAEQDVLVMAMPLYVDGVPSHMLSCLTELETLLKGRKITVYAIINCGFFEAAQNRWAIAILQNWCQRTGLKWGQAIGVGGGGMMPMLKDIPPGKGPKKNLSRALETLAKNILNEQSGETLLVSPNFPRFLYRKAAEMGWRRQIKENGLKAKDLSARPSGSC